MINCKQKQPAFQFKNASAVLLKDKAKIKYTVFCF